MLKTVFVTCEREVKMSGMPGLEKEMFCKDWRHYLKEKTDYSIPFVNVKRKRMERIGQGSKNF